MSKIPKIISGILAAILIAVVLYASLPPIWFWIVFEIFAALLVAVGCAGEWWLHHHPAGRKKVEKEEHHNLESRFIAAVVFGVFMELFSLGHAIPEAIKLENDVAVANARASSNDVQVAILKTNLAVLNKSTLELAHQYDLSTNALAEANARLATIRPLKERLIDWFNNFDPSIIPALRGGKTIFDLNHIPEYRFNALAVLLEERGSGQYVFSATNISGASLTLLAGVGQVESLRIELKPELAQ